MSDQGVIDRLTGLENRQRDEVKRLLDRNREAEELLREIHNSGVEMQDDRIDYMTIQVNKDTMKDIASWLEEEKP